MMCTSASVQVCLDAGHEEPGPLGHGRRWRLAHLLGAVLVAAFANSPLAGARVHRLALHPAGAVGGDRTPAGPARPPLDGDPRAAWAAARAGRAGDVRTARTSGPWDVPGRADLPGLDPVRGARPPTREDLDYHLTTLFPPVRPRGHLELRMIDAQPGDDGWIVPLAVTTALFDDPEAAETAYRAVKPLAERARSAARARAIRCGSTPPGTAWPTPSCATAAVDLLRRGRWRRCPGSAPAAAVQDAVAAFTDRYVARGRCPADDLLDRLHGADRRRTGRTSAHDRPRPLDAEALRRARRSTALDHRPGPHRRC